MRAFLVHDDRFQELPGEDAGAWADAMSPSRGFLWVGVSRREFEVHGADLQALMHRVGGGALVDLHLSDLLTNQLPSHFDYTSWYDVMVFRRLAVGSGAQSLFLDEEHGTLASAQRALASIDTSPVGFAVFDRLLVTVHPADCLVREHFAQRLLQQAQGSDTRASLRLPSSPADLMLRMVNHMVDSYLDLRRLLTRHFAHLQQELLSPRSRFDNWQVLVEARNSLHALEDTCEDQRSAIQEWIDALDEWPEPADAGAARDRELLRVRSRDVLEHIERVLGHVRRLEQAAETAVQMHFSALSHRTNDIMRTLTVLTAIFMPLNLITGIFGMNFDTLPLIHNARGVWVALSVMLVVGIALGLFFWRKRYIGGHPR